MELLKLLNKIKNDQHAIVYTIMVYDVDYKRVILSETSYDKMFSKLSRKEEITRADRFYAFDCEEFKKATIEKIITIILNHDYIINAIDMTGKERKQLFIRVTQKVES